MAKVTSFAEKAAKSLRKKEELISVKVVEAVFDQNKKSYKFNNKYVKVKELAELAKV
ncbi:MAG: hypothetical protein KJ666_16085 [Bacteroidetes bacterium]|nr:hypothetical protein [Bacteroidota bacterium]